MMRVWPLLSFSTKARLVWVCKEKAFRAKWEDQEHDTLLKIQAVQLVTIRMTNESEYFERTPTERYSMTHFWLNVHQSFRDEWLEMSHR